MNKKEQCTEIALANPEATRGELIELFLTTVPNISHGAANTYASSVKKAIIAEAPIRAQAAAVATLPTETDTEIAARLTERFDVIDMLANASCLGQVRSLIVSGPAGLGKSHTINQAVKAYDPDGKRTIITKGFVRATGLYLLLHEYKNKGDVVVLDDADSIFNDQDALNILKAACDTTHKRTLDWRSETKMLDADGNPIERTFEFKGTIIFITNKDFDKEVQKGGKMAEHYEALISRSHYVDTSMHSKRDYVIRIKQVVAMGMLRDSRDMNESQANMIVQFIEDNQDNLRELTLRMALKLADVYNMDASKFESLAKVSCFKSGVRH